MVPSAKPKGSPIPYAVSAPCPRCSTARCAGCFYYAA
nr:MAG TPA: hypothetical protein [Caudoviricetes sp.]